MKSLSFNEKLVVFFFHELKEIVSYIIEIFANRNFTISHSRGDNTPFERKKIIRSLFASISSTYVRPSPDKQGKQANIGKYFEGNAFDQFFPRGEEEKEGERGGKNRRKK